MIYKECQLGGYYWQDDNYKKYEFQDVNNLHGWCDCFMQLHRHKQAVKQTYNMAFKECESNYKYLTELVIALNHKCWALYHAGNKELSQLYHDLYYKAHHYACEHLKGEEFDYYFNIVD